MSVRRIRHKTEGWTGTIEEMASRCTGGSSSGCGLEVVYLIRQDHQTPDGRYVEDPEVNSLDELEIGEEVNA